MPYVKQVNREKLDKHIDALIKELAAQGLDNLEGNCNYTVSRLLLGSFTKVGRPSYRMYNRIGGILTCVWMEIYSRLVRPYEDQARLQNGDVVEYVQIADYHSKGY